MSSPTQKNHRKRPWKDQPAFHDITASVSAAQFAASRLPEIKDLVAGVVLVGDDADHHNSSLQSTGRKTSSRHLRRRVTSYKSRQRHRFPQSAPESTSTSRRAKRRKQQLLYTGHDEWRTVCRSSIHDTTKQNWMATHVWHAKRFRMAASFGWSVPLLHSNRGCAAALRLKDEKCLVHDATWCSQPIWIHGRGCDRSIVVRVLRRTGLEIAEPSEEEENNGVVTSGEGIVHHVDMFPVGAIGPVTWLWAKTPLFYSRSRGTGEEKEDDCFVYLIPHPSILSTVWSSLVEALADTENIQGPFIGIDGGIACLQLRGSVDAITKTYKTAAAAQVEHHAFPILHGVMVQQQSFHWIRCIRPRNHSLPANYGVCGWDVYCSADTVKELFQAVVLAGACPMGITEYTSLSLECDPPLPVFPRDFPDTEQGEAYWRGADAEDWTHVRRHWEGGMGRVRLPETTAVPPVRQIDLASQLEMTEQTAGDTRVVVVRGSFRDPMQKALTTCASIPPTTATAKRRKRRSAQKANFTTGTIPLAQERYALHQQYTGSLIDGLSLPAVVLVHLQLIGKGKINAGEQFYFDGESTVAGFATSGSFSVARGRFHGIGIVGVLALLGAILKAQSRRSAVSAPALQNKALKNIHLKFHLGTKRVDGVLTILGR